MGLKSAYCAAGAAAASAPPVDAPAFLSLAANWCFRSLRLRRTALGDASVQYWLTQSVLWPKIVELDLRNNRITDIGARALLGVMPPPDLTALLVGGNRIGDEMSDRLRDHFGDAVSFEEEEFGNGLR